MEKTGEFNDRTIGCGGVRVYGKDHKIFNNYFEGLTGSLWDAACTLTQGDATNDNVTQNSDLTKHYQIENLEFTHNTLVNNQSDIEIGYRDDWGRAPKNVLIANNIIVQDANPVTTVHETGTASDITFANNIIYTSDTGTLGDLSFATDEAENIDPLLVKTACKIPAANCESEFANAYFKLSSASSAVDPSPQFTIEEVSIDIEGQASIGSRDLGADEYNSTNDITNGMIDAQHVGPNAVPFTDVEPITLNFEEKEVSGVLAYPNPFQNKLKLSATEVIKRVRLTDLNGKDIEFFVHMDDSEMVVTPKESLPVGVYLLSVDSTGSNRKYKVVKSR